MHRGIVASNRLVPADPTCSFLVIGPSCPNGGVFSRSSSSAFSSISAFPPCISSDWRSRRISIWIGAQRGGMSGCRCLSPVLPCFRVNPLVPADLDRCRGSEWGSERWGFLLSSSPKFISLVPVDLFGARVFRLEFLSPAACEVESATPGGFH